MGTDSFWMDNETDSVNMGVISWVDGKFGGRVGIPQPGRKSRFTGELNLSHHRINNFWTRMGREFLFGWHIVMTISTEFDNKLRSEKMCLYNSYFQLAFN